jgi:hypothetical protein
MNDRSIITILLEDQASPVKLPVSTPKRRNRVELDRGEGRKWTPPPTARELTAADPYHGRRLNRPVESHDPAHRGHTA